MRGLMLLDDEIEEFRIWRKHRRRLSALDEAFEALERVMSNPFLRGYDSAFRVMGKCILELKKEIDK